MNYINVNFILFIWEKRLKITKNYLNYQGNRIIKNANYHLVIYNFIWLKHIIICYVCLRLRKKIYQKSLAFGSYS